MIGARFIVVDVRTGATIRYVSPAGRSYTCIWVIEISDVQAVVWESIPTPEYRVNPFKGLTQLDTWLWYDTEPYWVAAQRTVPSPTGALLDITVEAWVESIRWDLDGDGEWEHSQSIPQATKPLDPAAYRAFGGSEEDPAFTWVYETKGSYQPVMEVTWTGRWQWTALGGGWRYLDPQNVDSPVSVDYQVWEIRAFLTTED